MRGYDAWLEAPYVRAAAEAEAFLAWCEEYEIDSEASDAEAQWEAYLEDEEDAFSDAQAEAMRERAMERDGDW
jgi:hypothetical protein